MQENVLIDYLKATFTLKKLSDTVYPNDCDFYTELLDLLCVDSEYIETINGGLHGYRYTVQVGEYIKIFMTGPKTSDGYPTHLLEMTGQGCREFDSYGGDWIKLLSHLMDHDCKITRIDIANDLIDYKGITMEMILQKVKNGEYKTPRHRKIQIVKSDKIIGTENPGTSITFGTRKSSSVLQIYNKKAERIAKNVVVECDSWIRFELRLYPDKAEIFVLEYLLAERKQEGCLSVFFASVLSDFISFLEPPTLDELSQTIEIPQKRSWKTCHWWDDYLRAVPKIRIKNQHQLESTITKQICWLQTSVSKVLKRVVSALELNELIRLGIDLLSRAVEDLDRKDLAIVNTYRLENGLPKLTYNQMIDIILDFTEELERGYQDDID